MADYSFIDLHIHTEYSHEPGCDDTVEVVLKEAQEIAGRSGKDCLIAITDHNTILGIEEAKKLLATGKYPNVKLITGAEFTVDMSELNGVFGGNRVFRNNHILAYGFNEKDPDLIEFSRKFHAGRRPILRYSELVNLIQKAGGHLVIAHPGLIKINSRGIYNYTGPEKDEARETAQGIRSPKTILRNVPNAKFLLKVFYEQAKKRSGGILAGMERFHPDNYRKGFDKAIGEICENDLMLQTAGSDFHGYHLHTEFSVGNPFTRDFQNFYKDKLNDCTELQNGIHVSHLPGLELLTGEAPSKDREIRMINGHGEPITFDQYNIVVDSYREEQKNNNYSSGSNQNSNQKSYGKKGKKGGKGGKGGKRGGGNSYRTMYDYEDEIELNEDGEFEQKQIGDDE